MSNSEEIHHAYYEDEKGAIANREQVGLDVFPVCLSCHKTLHSKVNWVKDRVNPVLKNCNTIAAIQRLRIGYQLLA